MEGSLRVVILGSEPLTPGPEQDNCLVFQLEKQVDYLSGALFKLTDDILSLEKEEWSLLHQEPAFHKALFDLSLRTERLFSDQTRHPPRHRISRK